MQFSVSVVAFFVFFTQPARAESEASSYYNPVTKKYYTNGRTNFSIRALEKNAYVDRIEVSIDEDSYIPYSGKLSFTKEGHHTIRFRAIDPVLNWSPLQVFQIYVDLTPPLTKWSWKGELHSRDGQTYVHPNTKLAIAPEDALSGPSVTWMKLDSDEPRAIKDQILFAKSGPHSISLYTDDHVGNREPAQEFKFIVDDKPPVSEVHLDGENYRGPDRIFANYATKLILGGADEGAGLKKIEYQINGGLAVTYSKPIPVTAKQFTLRYRAHDFVGNVEPWKTTKVYQDAVVPRLAVRKEGRFVNVGGKLFATGGFKLRAEASDLDSGIRGFMVSRDFSDFLPTKDSEFKFDNVGEYRINIRAVDNVGNLSESGPMTVVVDKSAPVTDYKFNEKFVNQNGTLLVALPNRLEFVSHDQGVGVDHIEYSYDGKNFTLVRNPVDIAAWKESARTIYYRSMDLLGNTEPTKKLDIQVLIRGPIVDLFVESENLPDVPLSKIMSTPPKKLDASPDVERTPGSVGAPKK